MSRLLIQYRSNKSAHEDIYLSIDSKSRVSDSYYLAEDNSDKKTEDVLVCLLEQWLKALGQATNGKPTFLPYDFSDQYTGCLKCVLEGDTFQIQIGWSSREGWSVSPSNPADFFHDAEDFHANESSIIKISRKDFRRQIEDSIAHAKSNSLNS